MGKSSKDKRDAYYRLAKEQGWRARSAFKLLQLDEEFNLFANVSRVVDLCAAPGSWSQVLSRVLVKGERFGRVNWEDRRAGFGLAEAGEGEVEGGKTEEGKASARGEVRIVAVDLQPMSPLPGITMLRADITHPSTIPLILSALDPPSPTTPTTPPTNPNPAPVDLILSDGAPDVTGLHDLDIYMQSQLLWAALSLSLRILKPGGTFVAKIFRGKDVDLLFAQLRLLFRDVVVAKPRSSRASSLEAFVVCRGFCPPLMEVMGEEGAGAGAPLGAGRDVVSGMVIPRTKASRRVREDGIVELELGSDDDDDDDDGGGEAEEGDKGATNNDEGPTTTNNTNSKTRAKPRRWIPPFLACGDLTSYDSDATYQLPAGHVSLDPVQPPTAPPYKRALENRRRRGGGGGGGVKGKWGKGEVSVGVTGK